MAKDDKVNKNNVAAKTAGQAAASGSGKNIAIAVLATLLTVVLILLALCLTGVIRFGGDNDRQGVPSISNNASTEPGGGRDSDPEPTTGTTASGVTCYDDQTRAQVNNLEFCLPDDFRAGGKVNDGAYAYNLVDDDGWAEVRVYVTKSQQSPTQFINNLSSNLKVVDKNYSVNGTTWARAEASDNLLAFATRSGDYIYAVLYTIKLDSDDATEAWNMIPKTLTITEK